MNAWLQKIKKEDMLSCVWLSRLVGTFAVALVFLTMGLGHFLEKDMQHLSQKTEIHPAYSALAMDLNREVTLTPQVKSLFCTPSHRAEQNYYFYCKTIEVGTDEERTWWIKTDPMVFVSNLSFKLAYEKEGALPFLYVVLDEKGQQQMSRSLALENIKQTILGINQEFKGLELASQKDANLMSWKKGDINGN